MLKISIPKPCHEDWNRMTSNNEGRHCNSCMKTVIDFTGMTDDEVRNILINKKEEHLCGRFHNNQLQRIQLELPADIYYMQMPLWKKFLVACLVVFSTTLFSCDIKHADATSGKIETTMLPEYLLGGPVGVINRDSTRIDPKVNTDTAFVPPVIMGDFEIRPIGDTAESILLDIVGKPAYNPVDTIPINQPGDSIKGEILFVPDSNKNDKKCPEGI